MSRAAWALQTAAGTSLLAAGRVLPLAALRGVGATLGRIFYVLDRRHRTVTLDNLRRAFGSEWPESRIRQVAWASWSHFGRVLGETLYMPRLTRRNLDRWVRMEGWRHLEDAYRTGDGVLLFSAHFGHWELVAYTQALRGLKLSLVTRPLDHPVLERFARKIRTASGNDIIHRRGAVRQMLRVLRQGGGVAIVIDQDARQGGIFVPFLGQPASTSPTLATLALKTGARVVPVFAVPDTRGRYHVTYGPPVPHPSSGDFRKDVYDLTARCTGIVESWILRYPEYWTWMHRRWKTPPPEGPHAS